MHQPNGGDCASDVMVSCVRVYVQGYFHRSHLFIQLYNTLKTSPNQKKYIYIKVDFLLLLFFQ